MNITTFNDPFRDAVINVSSEKVFQEFAKSPLFVHSIKSTEEEAKAYNTFLGSEELLPLPYPMFRLSLSLTYINAGAYLAYFVKVHENNEWEVFIDVRPPKDIVRRLETSKGGKLALMVGLIRISKEELSYSLYDRDAHKWIRPDDPSISIQRMSDPVWAGQSGIEAVKLPAMQAILGLTAFAEDVMLPTNHIAEVSPDREGKSIEWVKGRTHYTIITHDHAANNKDLAHAKRPSVAGGETPMTRTAHNRRAHYRTLKSERFKYARGQTIFVRSTWVGPKEWKDEGSQQIYKILEPVKEETKI